MFNKNNPQNPNQMAQMYQLMNNYKKMQQSNLLAKINELEKNRDRLNLDKDELRNAIIRPIKIEKADKQEVIIKYRDLENNVSSKRELDELWKKRTNQAYKNIIKDEKYQKKDYKKKEDLIVHKVTDADKLGVDNELKDFQGKIEVQNGELKIQYSASKETEHKKKFEYNNKYKYAAKYDPKAHDDLKDDNVEYFKKEQEKNEKDKKKVDDIIQSLLNSNILSEEEKKDLALLQDKSEELNEEIKKDIKEKSKEKTKNKEVKQEESDSENEKKPIKITIKSKKVNDESSEENKKEDKSGDKLEVKVDEDLRNKYLNRKKKN
jgi:hypothetical protein